MGFFSSDRFTRPGPGVSPDAPRKKGAARLFEMLGRDMWSFFRAGFLAFVGSIPLMVGMFLAIETHAVLMVVLAGVIGGLILGPELTALADTILRSLRDEPGYWWQTYRRAWKRNAKESLLPGVIFGLVVGIQLFTMFHLQELEASSATWIMLFVSIFLTVGLFTYIWPQIALLDMPFYGVLKNSVLLFLGYLPRSAGALFIQLIYWGVMALFFPLTLGLLPFTNFWVPTVPALLCVYIPLDRSFSIEKTINRMREDDLASAIARDTASQDEPRS
ncbi:MAG: DUF624 domain-containing protein [Gemmiger sp.]|uniref:DUF624 domain-containing protein n=1 Tax=Gemmiger sp. TaxID=2049027 RepID=UPI002E7653AC|nr:DUF624 domain-containing protein [Gemmiger sp.]MEE0802045.1 DUF624 domain-containing protein [Gemmiger sp.]